MKKSIFRIILSKVTQTVPKSGAAVKLAVCAAKGTNDKFFFNIQLDVR